MVNEMEEDAPIRRVTPFLPLRRMEVGQSFFVPPELMVGGEKRYHSVRQTIYRWGYKNGYGFQIRRKDGGLWVKRVEREVGGQESEEGASTQRRATVSDASVQEPGVQEAHPVGA